MRYDSNLIRTLKEKYPSGTRIRLGSMEAPYAPIEPGTEGSVKFVDDAGQIHMKWDNGRSLPLILGEDTFSIIPKLLQQLQFICI
jgi:hypothetical protein